MLQNGLFVFLVLGTAVGLFSSFTSVDEEPIFDKSVSHGGYKCPGGSLTWTTSFHQTEVVSIQYSNGTVVQGSAYGQSVTSTTSGGPAVFSSFTVSWNECLHQLGLGCSPCLPFKACTTGCDF